MPGIRIRDLTERGFLAFDLADLLGVLGQQARESSWRCSVEDCISTEGAHPNLADAYNSPSGLTGPQLLALASETRQVIDGVFEAFRHGERSPWLKLEAIDSTYWEVSAENPARLSVFQSRFADVENIEEGAA